VPKNRKRCSRRSIPQQDGSYLIRYRGQRYSIRLRRHVETDTWDVVSIWSETQRSPLPVPVAPPRDRWEDLLAGGLNRSVEKALQAAERCIETWLDRCDAGQLPGADNRRS
jgi:hypothetical protein